MNEPQLLIIPGLQMRGTHCLVLFAKGSDHTKLDMILKNIKNKKSPKH